MPRKKKTDKDEKTVAKKKSTAKKKTTTPKPKPKPAPKVPEICETCKYWDNANLSDTLGTCQNEMSHWHTVNRKSTKTCEFWKGKV